MMIRLLIADDERLEREALAEMVTRRFVEHEICLLYTSPSPRP